MGIIIRNNAVATIQLLLIALIIIAADTVLSDTTTPLVKKTVKGKTVCDRGWECKGWSEHCCNETISDYFQTYNFEELFPNRNAPVAHAVGFYDYKSFLQASALYQPLGFGTTGNKTMRMLEIAAFFGHVGSKTNCGYGVATGGPLAWGLCYKKEESPSQKYCDEYYKYTYPCAPGADYYGRGALPIFWNYNYGKIGEELKIDLLNHPEYLEQNSTLAFITAIHLWMRSEKKLVPSAHDVFVGNWKPTKNDTLSNRVPGFGTTMNVLYGDQVCGQGSVDQMNNIVSHFLEYCDLMGIGREAAGPHDGLTCAEQKAFKPSYKSASS